MYAKQKLAVYLNKSVRCINMSVKKIGIILTPPPHASHCRLKYDKLWRNHAGSKQMLAAKGC